MTTFVRRLFSAVLPAALWAALPSPPARAQEPPLPRVRPGLDVLLSERRELIVGKRIGLVANQASVDARLRPAVDLLAADPAWKLVRLFAPEHGVRGDVPAGDPVPDAVDAATGVPVASLYGASKRPSPASLAGLDVVVFDLQDVGVRLYTYLATLGEVLRACADARLPVVVLDRPNPLGGTLIEGPVRREEFAHFVAYGPLPVVHGLTAGEAARFFRAEMKIDCALTVVPARGLRRADRFADTGLTWTPTSPHMPRPAQADAYAATAPLAFATQDLCDGVGTTLPFEVLLAEGLDGAKLARELATRATPGVRFQAFAARPFYGKFAGKTLHGVRLIVDDPRRFRPFRTALELLTALARTHPGRPAFETPRLVGVHFGRDDLPALVRAGKTPDEIEAVYEAELAAYRARVRPHLLYE